MSVVSNTGIEVSAIKTTKRKRDDELDELEVDVNAAEPPSKKALRRAKRNKTTLSVGTKDSTTNSRPQREVKPENDATSNKTRSPYGVWIGNLSFATTKDDLMSFMTSDSDHPISQDEVTRIHLPTGQAKTGLPQNKGFAYIDVTNEAVLNHALELSEKLLTGRRVLIKNAKSFEGRPASKEDVASGKPPSRRIFVGNLSFDTTPEALDEHFGVCGTIQKTQVATFEDSGKCKGYAWIEFEQLSSAQAAMRGWVEQGSDGGAKQSKRRIWLKKMEGRQLRMEFAEDATTRYNKRYGKDAKKKSTDGEAGGDEVQQDAIVEVDESSARTQSAKPKRDEARKPRSSYGYGEETVQRLTGAITESHGKKVTFD